MDRFQLRNFRVITSVDQMTPVEIQQWLSYLRFENLELAERMDEDGSINFFDPEYEGSEHYEEEIWIQEWEWRPSSEKCYPLTDIFCWPGDNQDGAIFMGDDLTPQCRNTDTNLYTDKGYIKCDAYLKEILDDFGHLRSFYKHGPEDETCSNYEWCQGHRKQWKTFSKRHDNLQENS